MVNQGGLVAEEESTYDACATWHLAGKANDPCHSGGLGSNGADGGPGGNITVTVDNDDTDLLLPLSFRAKGGSGGQPGYHGAPGNGGPGGPGGYSYYPINYGNKYGYIKCPSVDLFHAYRWLLCR